MRETLYLRLRDGNAEPVEYCVARADALASFTVAQAPLDEVLKLAAHRRVVVLVPSEHVRLASAAVPAKQAGKALLAVPFALEELLAEDVDTLHFALGTRQPDGRWPVAVVARERLQTWLAPLRAAGIAPEAMLPDVLALAAPDAGHFTALVDGQQLLVRTGADAGFVCLLDDLALCLQLADPDRQRRLRLAIPRGTEIDPSALAASIDWPVEPLHGVATPLEVLLQQLQRGSAINLLQGRHAPQSDALRWFVPWKAAAGLAGVTLAVAALTHGVETWKLQRELRMQDTANVQRYQAAFPDETRIVDLSVQLNQRLAALQTGGGGAQMLPLLGVLNNGISAVPGLQLQSLQFRDGALYAGLSATNLELLERLKNWFASANAASFSVESANAGADGVQIRVRLGAT